MLDASAGGSIKWKTPEEAYELIENMTANDKEAYTERAHSQKKGILELQSQDALLAQNKIMTQQLGTLMKKLSLTSSRASKCLCSSTPTSAKL